MEKRKTKSKKWIVAIVLIAIIVIVLGLYLNAFSIPTGLIAGETPTEETKKEAPEFTITGNEIISKETTETLPYYESVYLESGRYTFDFRADVPVWVFVYSEERFNQWMEGEYTFTRTGTACCKEKYKVKSLTTNFDIPQEEGGKHYIVVEGAEEAPIKFKIIQKIRF